MKITTQSCSNRHARVRTSKSLTGKRTVFFDMWGNSYSAAAQTENEADDFANDLRKMADWVETYGVNYLKRETK